MLPLLFVRVRNSSRRFYDFDVHRGEGDDRFVRSSRLRRCIWVFPILANL